MSRALLAALAVVLCGCPPPFFPTLVREEPVAPPDYRPHRTPRAYEPGRCPVPDSLRLWADTCKPSDFNRFVTALAPALVSVQQFDGRRVSGGVIRVVGDSAWVDDRAVPMDGVESVWLTERRSLGERAQIVGATTAGFAAAGAVLGLTGGLVNSDRGVGEATVGGLVGLGAVGLAVGVSAARAESSRRFRVEGWIDPALTPGRPSLLVSEGSTARPTWTLAPTTTCGHAVPEAATWIGRCTPPSVLTDRAAARWVQTVEAQMRDGSVLGGRDLVVSGEALWLDGREVPLAGVREIHLRAPRGPGRLLRPTARGAIAGAAYGLLFGGTISLLGGDGDALWAVPAGLGVLGAGGGLAVGLLRGPDHVRDVTYLPDPAP